MNQRYVTAFSMSESQVEPLWAIYREAFRGAGDNCAQLQTCYDESSFLAAIIDEEYAKIIGLGDDGLPVGFALLTNNLDKASITYVNPQKLRNAYPKEEAEGRVWYCTAMVISPAAQGRNHSAPIFDGMTELLLSRRAVLAFDYGEDKPEFERYVTTLFMRAVRKIRGSAENVPCVVLGGQKYCTLSAFGHDE